MDLATGAKKLVITMTHIARNGAAKVVHRCDLPLTATNAVDVLITDLGVFQFDGDDMKLVRLMQGVTLEQLQDKTEASFSIHLKD
jgi:3-oxoacid CoA-transferase B subunit